MFIVVSPFIALEVVSKLGWVVEFSEIVVVILSILSSMHTRASILISLTNISLDCRFAMKYSLIDSISELKNSC